MRWVHTNGGLVNLDRVTHIKRTSHGYRLYGDDLPTNCTADLCELLDDRLEDELIPAAAGAVVAVVSVYDENEKIEHSVDIVQVVAWRVSHYNALPVIAGDALADNQKYLIPCPDGKYIEPYNCSWNSLEEGVADIVGAVQRAREFHS